MAAPPTDLTTDPNSPLVNISCFDLLLIELVPLAERMARSYEASLDRPSSTPSSAVNHRRGVKPASSTPTNSNTGNNPSANPPTSNTGPGSASGNTNNNTVPATLAGDGLPETDIFRDSVYVRLERLGFRVGQGLCERFSRDRPRFNDQLDVIKFLCKDLWVVVFKKQIDNLKTNHRVCSFNPPTTNRYQR